MNVIRWFQASYARSSVVCALLLAVMTLAAAWLLRAGVPNAAALALAMMGVTILLTGLLVRSAGMPRWALVAAAAVLAVGTPLAALFAHDPLKWTRGAIGSLSYSWIYVWIAGSTPLTGSRLCASPWAVIAGSLILVAASWVTAVLR